MTIHHFFYIPAIFLLGIVFGITLHDRRRGILAIKAMAPASLNNPALDKTSGKKLFLAFLIFLLVFVLTHLFEIPWGLKAVRQLLGGLELFDRSPVFSSNEVYERLKQFPVEGIIAYKHFTYTTDFIFPLSFLAFLWTLARFVSQRIRIPNSFRNLLIGLPFCWFASDLLENMVIFSILSKFPQELEFLAGSLGAITLLKFSLLVLSILTPSLLFVFYQYRTETIKNMNKSKG